MGTRSERGGRRGRGGPPAPAQCIGESLVAGEGRMTYGGIEAGGTKWVCAIGSGPDDLRDIVTFPTTTPKETIARAADFFANAGSVAAIGIGSFGPIDIRHGSPTWGHIMTTPKPGWADTDIARSLAHALDLPVAFDTDVNAAALGEHRWGAAVGLDTFCYVNRTTPRRRFPSRRSRPRRTGNGRPE